MMKHYAFVLQLSRENIVSINDRRRRLKAAEELVKKIPQPYLRTLTGPSAVKKFFSRQDNAIHFAAEFGDEACVFAFETASLGGDGARRFLVTSAECFWHEYRQIGEEYKHYYEVIPEGKKCRLYCDLEFSTIANPKCDGDKICSLFVDVLIQSLSIAFGVKINCDEIIVLDSCSSIKFSKHLIFNSDSTTFRNNVRMGVFMRAIHRALEMKCEKQTQAACPECTELSKRLSSQLKIESNSAEQLWVNNPKGSSGGPPVTFCDLGVYTRNRNFRLLHSSKLGKHVYLKKDGNWPTSASMTDEQLFMRSLVTNATAASFLSVSCICQRSILAERVSNPNKHEGAILESADQLIGHQVSPYAEVDNFILQEVLGQRGRIRRWVYFPSREVISYDIVGNRFCRNIGREHRSNNVMYIVDLKQKVYYQKCYDPDCKQQNYRSEGLSLPLGILPWDGLVAEIDETGDPQPISSMELLEDKDENDKLPVDSSRAVENEYEDLQLLVGSLESVENEDEDDQVLANSLEAVGNMDADDQLLANFLEAVENEDEDDQLLVNSLEAVENVDEDDQLLVNSLEAVENVDEDDQLLVNSLEAVENKDEDDQLLVNSLEAVNNYLDISKS